MTKKIWNYRFVRYSSGSLGLHEVCYNPDGSPSAWSEEPATFSVTYAKGPEGIIQAMAAAMVEASSLPVLSLENLPATSARYLRKYPKLPDDSRTLGQIAFDSYNADRGGLNYQGLKTPEWPDLPEGIRHAWGMAVQAIICKMLPPVV